MIYIIIGRDRSSHNEWVEKETFTVPIPAADLCNHLNVVSDTADYRVETVQSDIIANGITGVLAKLILNGQYGKSVPVYADTDSMREFTMDELFPQGTHAVTHTLTCSECSCEVKNMMQFIDGHTKWHNKLLP